MMALSFPEDVLCHPSCSHSSCLCDQLSDKKQPQEGGLSWFMVQGDTVCPGEKGMVAGAGGGWSLHLQSAETTAVWTIPELQAFPTQSNLSGSTLPDIPRGRVLQWFWESGWQKKTTHNIDLELAPASGLWEPRLQVCATTTPCIVYFSVFFS